MKTEVLGDVNSKQHLGRMWSYWLHGDRMAMTIWRKVPKAYSSWDLRLYGSDDVFIQLVYRSTSNYVGSMAIGDIRAYDSTTMLDNKYGFWKPIRKDDIPLIMLKSIGEK